MKKVLLGLLFAMSSLFASATLFHGTTQTITVDSDPSGARVYVDGRLMGSTPVVLNLKKNKYSTITIKKECYKPATIVLQKSYDPVALLDIFWDLSTTDFLTGAISEYSPNNYYVKLQKLPNCQPAK